MTFNSVHEQHETMPISRKQLFPLSLLLRYDRTEVTRRIDESLNDIVDLQERQRVQKVLWKNWFLFIEPVQTKKVEKLLCRQRSQYEHRQHLEQINHEYTESDENCFHQNQSNNVVVLKQQDSSNWIWPDGTETWHLHEIKPQRGLFTDLFRVKLMAIQHFGNNHEPNHLEQQPRFATANLYDEQLHDTIVLEAPVALDSVWPVGTESWHFHDVKPQREEIYPPSRN